MTITIQDDSQEFRDKMNAMYALAELLIKLGMPKFYMTGAIPYAWQDYINRH